MFMFTLANQQGLAILLIVIYILAMIFGIWCHCKISGKLGHSPWMGLLVILPLVWLLFMAFAEAPNEKLAKRYKREKRKAKRSGGNAPRTAPAAGSSGSAWSSTPEDRAADALDDMFG